jgi:hypothetical protein
VGSIANLQNSRYLFIFLFLILCPINSRRFGLPEFLPLCLQFTKLVGYIWICLPFAEIRILFPDIRSPISKANLFGLLLLSEATTCGKHTCMKTIALHILFMNQQCNSNSSKDTLAGSKSPHSMFCFRFLFFSCCFIKLFVL